MMLKRKRVIKTLAVLGILGMMSTTATAADISMVGMSEEYKAYRLLDLDVALKTKPVWVCNCGETMDVDKYDAHAQNHVENDQPANGFTKEQTLCGHEEDAHEDTCYTFNYTVNTKYADVLKEAAVETDLNWDTDKDQAISDTEIKKGLEAMNAAQSSVFASALNEKVAAMDPEETTTKDTDNVFMNVEQGYYLLTGDDTIALLDTRGEDFFTVTNKELAPTVTAKIRTPYAPAESGYRYFDAKDLYLGEETELEVTISVPANVENYKNYGFRVYNDAEGIQLSGEETITVNGEVVEFVGTKDAANKNHTFYTPVNLDDCTLQKDGANVSFTQDSEIKIVYPITLSDDFTTNKTGNSIQTWIEYQNNPVEVESFDTTVKDKVVCFTYQATVANVTETDEPLTGADYKLYRQDEQAFNWVEVEIEANESLTKTEFQFKGLGPGSYKLEETTVPEGYTKADIVLFDLRANYDRESDNPMLQDLSVFINGQNVTTGDNPLFSKNVDTGTVSTKIVNTKQETPGPEGPDDEIDRLPSTGETERYFLLFGGTAIMLIGLASFIKAGKTHR